MNQVRVFTESRAIPVTTKHAFDGTITVSLPEAFARWYGPIAPVSSTDPGGPGSPAWGTVGQTRVVSQGGGSMREELVDVSAPDYFAYRLTDLKGPLAALIDHIEGRWEFAPAGTGTLVTWTWNVHPTRLGVPTMAVFDKLWHGFARQGLSDLSDILLRSPSA